MSKQVPNRPDSLAQSALELFAKRGFDEVTIDEIAAQAGVTKGSFYSHYKSKHEIILAACAHYYRTYQQRIHAEIAPLTDPLARLRRMLEVSVNTCVADDRNRVFTAEIFALALKDGEVRKGWAQFHDTVREIYVGLLLAAQTAGQLDVPDPRRAVELMLAAMEGIKMRAAFEPSIADTAQRQAMVESLLGMMTS